MAVQDRRRPCHMQYFYLQILEASAIFNGHGLNNGSKSGFCLDKKGRLSAQKSETCTNIFILE